MKTKLREKLNLEDWKKAGKEKKENIEWGRFLKKK